MIEMIYVALRETKNYTLYQNEDLVEGKMNQLYLPKGLPQRLLVTISEVPNA